MSEIFSDSKTIYDTDTIPFDWLILEKRDERENTAI